MNLSSNPTGPDVRDLEPGLYSWCACGASQNGALCDGRHMGRGICPKTFPLDAPRRVALCTCLKTTTPPYCDGSHAGL